MLSDPALDPDDVRKRPVPARFELPGHQPVLRIGGVVLPECAVGGVTGGLEVAQ